QTQTVTRYNYDAQNRLTQVVVDLSPGDNSIADGKTYSTAYTYDGTSKRIASITQGDGTTISFTYEQVGTSTVYRVKTYTDGEGKATTLTYTQTTDATPTSATANAAVLSTTDTQTTTQTYNLNTSALTGSGSGAWSGAALLDGVTPDASQASVRFDQNGNGFAVWQTDSAVYVRRYDKASNTWGTTLNLAANANSADSVQLGVDPAGNAIVTWYQWSGSGVVWAARYSASTNTWSSAQLIDANAGSFDMGVGAINAAGQAVVAWVQSDGTNYNLYARRYTGGSWQSIELLETLA